MFDIGWLVALRHQGADPGQGSRIQELLSSVPLTTLLFMGLNIGLSVCTEVRLLDAGSYSISAYNVVYKMQWYRVITSAFFHGGVLHIAMNMMTLFYLGASLVRESTHAWCLGWRGVSTQALFTCVSVCAA